MSASGVLALVLALVLATCLCANARAGQEPVQREITSDDFGRTDDNAFAPGASASGAARPATTPAGRRPGPNARSKATYKLARRVSQPFPRKPDRPRPPRPTGAPRPAEEVGVTLWRLRPRRATDKGPQMPAQADDGRRVWLTPERVGANTQFGAGDRVRLAVESKRQGYLYVVNGELYTGGRVGKPYLLFPAPADTDAQGRLLPHQANRVRPGLLVDIPDQLEELPYFVIEPRSPDYVGEFVLLIISPTPLEGLKLRGPEQEIVNGELLTRWDEQWGADVELYVKEGGEGDALTTAEQEATCGAKTRQLVRQKLRVRNDDPAPCGPRMRLLTREEPLPQSIYRVSVPKDQPVIVPVLLTVRGRG